MSRIRRHGALTIRDIDDDELIEEPRVGEPQAVEARLQLAFFRGG